MRIMTLAVGLATGYVLGTRAGRQKYEQIATVARRVSGHPITTQVEGGAEASLPPTESVTVPAVVNPIEQPAADVAGTKPRRPRNRRTKSTTAATPSASDSTHTMSTADLSLDALPPEAAEADALEQNTPAVDNSEEPATTPLPLEADADDVREQRRSL